MSAKPLLIVEDDHDIREMLHSLLQDEGYTVWSAANGRAALELLDSKDQAPGLILLDLMMPVMDGETFLGEITKDPRLAPIPVLMLTASHSGASLKVAGYLKKPLDLDELLEFVARLSRA
ncbi:MAG: response regulator [Bdellovibrionales bacterium]|nr:response regulator [Bdellovibrionales bacterium]